MSLRALKVDIPRFLFDSPVSATPRTYQHAAHKRNKQSWLRHSTESIAEPVMFNAHHGPEQLRTEGSCHSFSLPVLQPFKHSCVTFVRSSTILNLAEKRIQTLRKIRHKVRQATGIRCHNLMKMPQAPTHDVSSAQIPLLQFHLATQTSQNSLAQVSSMFSLLDCALPERSQFAYFCGTRREFLHTPPTHIK